jgi:hypothetical protein
LAAINNKSKKGKKQDKENHPAGANMVAKWVSPSNVVTVVICLISAALFVGTWYINSDRVARLDERLKALTYRLETAGVFRDEYKRLAIARGFKDPEIIPVDLAAYRDRSISRPPIVQLKGEQYDVPYDLTVELFDFVNDRIGFRLTGTVGGKRFEHHYVWVPLKLNLPMDATPVPSKIGSRIPRFFVEIIAFPSLDIAVAVVGPKEPISRPRE